MAKLMRVTIEEEAPFGFYIIFSLCVDHRCHPDDLDTWFKCYNVINESFATFTDLELCKINGYGNQNVYLVFRKLDESHLGLRRKIYIGFQIQNLYTLNRCNPSTKERN